MFLNLSLLHGVGQFMPSYQMYDTVDTHRAMKKAIFKQPPPITNTVVTLKHSYDDVHTASAKNASATW
jgi:hypothetical protein